MTTTGRRRAARLGGPLADAVRSRRRRSALAGRRRGGVVAVAACRRAARRRGASRAPACARRPRRCGGLPATTRATATRASSSPSCDGRDDPRPAVEAITDAALAGGRLPALELPRVMHTVGRTYASDAGVTLATLMDYLPQTTTRAAPPASRTGSSPASRRHRPGAAARGRARVRRRGHALPALQLHPRLRPRVHADLRAIGSSRRSTLCARARRARGARLRAGRLPRLLVRGPRRRRRDARRARRSPTRGGCAARSRRRSCARAGTARSSRTARAGFRSSRRRTSRRSARASTGSSAPACITAASVIGPPDPAAQLAHLRAARGRGRRRELRARDEGAEPARRRTTELRRLIGGCARFAGGGARRCYRWLGKTLAVLTDGEFARDGCPRLGLGRRPPAVRGGRAHDGTAARDVQLTAGRPARVRHPGQAVTPRGTDWSLALLVALGVATGLATWFAGSPGSAGCSRRTRAGGIALAIVLVCKLRRVLAAASRAATGPRAAGVLRRRSSPPRSVSGSCGRAAARCALAGYNLLTWHAVSGGVLGSACSPRAAARQAAAAARRRRPPPVPHRGRGGRVARSRSGSSSARSQRALGLPRRRPALHRLLRRPAATTSRRPPGSRTGPRPLDAGALRAGRRRAGADAARADRRRARRRRRAGRDARLHRRLLLHAALARRARSAALLDDAGRRAGRAPCARDLAHRLPLELLARRRARRCCSRPTSAASR